MVQHMMSAINMQIAKDFTRCASEKYVSRLYLADLCHRLSCVERHVMDYVPDEYLNSYKLAVSTYIYPLGMAGRRSDSALFRTPADFITAAGVIKSWSPVLFFPHITPFPDGDYHPIRGESRAAEWFAYAARADREGDIADQHLFDEDVENSVMIEDFCKIFALSEASIHLYLHFIDHLNTKDYGINKVYTSRNHMICRLTQLASGISGVNAVRHSFVS